MSLYKGFKRLVKLGIACGIAYYAGRSCNQVVYGQEDVQQGRFEQNDSSALSVDNDLRSTNLVDMQYSSSVAVRGDSLEERIEE